jgi:nitroreductase
MKSFLELVQSRQSDRAYDPSRPVEPEKLAYILETTRLSPSACNAQPWKFVVVTNPEIKAQTASAIGRNHFSNQAPVHIVIVEESANLTSSIGSTIKGKHFPHMDLGIAAAHLTLAATDQGLGSCIIGWFDEKKIRKILNIPSSKRPVLIIAIGYAAQPFREKKRKKEKDVVSYNEY